MASQINAFSGFSCHLRTMENNGNLFRVILIISLLALPAIGLRILSHYSSDPYLQPLALSEVNVAAVGNGRGGGNVTKIVVHVDWGGASNEHLTKEGLRDLLTKTLTKQTEQFHIIFYDTPGSKIVVTFKVGPNSYGPFPPTKISNGLHSALIALRMTHRIKG